MIKKLRYFIISFFIAIYKSLFSDFSGRQCRFEPTCSLYAKQTITKHGILFGIFFTLKRIIRCNPLYKRDEPYIFDPIPEKTYDK